MHAITGEPPTVRARVGSANAARNIIAAARWRTQMPSSDCMDAIAMLGMRYASSRAKSAAAEDEKRIRGRALVQTLSPSGRAAGRPGGDGAAGAGEGERAAAASRAHAGRGCAGARRRAGRACQTARVGAQVRRACVLRRVSHALTRRVVAAPPAARSKRSSPRTRATTRSPSGFGALCTALRRAPSTLTPQGARRYLAWTQTHYPVDGPESQLLATLHDCGHTLLPLERYKADVRYLRVWVQYVRPSRSRHVWQRSRAASPRRPTAAMSQRRSSIFLRCAALAGGTQAHPGVLTRLARVARSTTASGRSTRCSTRRAPRSSSCAATSSSRSPSTRPASPGACGACWLLCERA
jgi:hypothetical protein